MSRVVPHVLGLTYNGLSHDGVKFSNGQAIPTVGHRIPFVPTVPVTRFRFAWLPGRHDANGAGETWDVAGLSLVGAHVGEHSAGAITRKIADVAGAAGADVSSGVWLSDWTTAALEAGREYALTFAWANPQGKKLPAGSMYGYHTASAAGLDDLTAAAWNTAGSKVGVGSPLLILDTPADPLVIAYSGDSNVAAVGAGAPFFRGAAATASTLTGHCFVPLGYTGEQLVDYTTVNPRVTRVRDLVAQAQGVSSSTVRWDAVVLEAGVNDFLVGATTSSVQAYLAQAALVAQAELAPRVYAATIPAAGGTGPTADNRIAYNEALRADVPFEVAGVLDTAVAVDDPAKLTHLLPEFNSGDGVHSNSEGQAAIGAVLATVVQKIRPTGGGGGAGTLFATTLGRSVRLVSTAGRALFNSAYQGASTPPAAPSWPVTLFNDTPVAWTEMTEEAAK